MSTDNQVSGSVVIYQEAKELVTMYLKEYLEEYLAEGGEIVGFDKFYEDGVTINLSQAKEFVALMEKKAIRPALKLEANPNKEEFFLYKDQKSFNIDFFVRNSNGVVKIGAKAAQATA